MELSDEIRNAVHREDCEKIGHRININSLLAMRIDANMGGVELRSDEGKLPHLVCDHCGWTVIVLPVNAYDYESAERAVYGLLRAETEAARDIVRRRGKRDSQKGKLEPRE